jgi:hypothetical protein
MAISVELPPAELQRTRQNWPGSHAQKFIHNRFVDELQRARIVLENVSDFEAFQKAKARVDALKELIGLIHEDDADSIKKFYGLK